MVHKRYGSEMNEESMPFALRGTNVTLVLPPRGYPAKYLCYALMFNENAS